MSLCKGGERNEGKLFNIQLPVQSRGPGKAAPPALLLELISSPCEVGLTYSSSTPASSRPWNWSPPTTFAHGSAHSLVSAHTLVPTHSPATRAGFHPQPCP